MCRTYEKFMSFNALDREYYIPVSIIKKVVQKQTVFDWIWFYNH